MVAGRINRLAEKHEKRLGFNFMFHKSGKLS